MSGTRVGAGPELAAASASLNVPAVSAIRVDLASGEGAGKRLVYEFAEGNLEPVGSGPQFREGISVGRGRGDIDDKLWGIGKGQLALNVVPQLDPASFILGERRARGHDGLGDVCILSIAVLPNDEMMARNVGRQQLRQPIAEEAGHSTSRNSCTLAHG